MKYEVYYECVELNNLVCKAESSTEASNSEILEYMKKKVQEKDVHVKNKWLKELGFTDKDLLDLILASYVDGDDLVIDLYDFLTGKNNGHFRFKKKYMSDDGWIDWDKLYEFIETNDISWYYDFEYASDFIEQIICEELDKHFSSDFMFPEGESYKLVDTDYFEHITTKGRGFIFPTIGYAEAAPSVFRMIGGKVYDTETSDLLWRKLITICFGETIGIVLFQTNLNYS